MTIDWSVLLLTLAFVAFIGWIGRSIASAPDYEPEEDES